MTAPGGTPDGVAWLFCPADRPERFARAAAEADTVILDLEDGVAAAERPAARRAIAAAAGHLDPARTVIRINPTGTPEQQRDLEVLRAGPFRRVMLAKAGSPQDLAPLRDLDVVALCESARGVLAAAAIGAEPNCTALMWGAEDLLADLGGFASRDASGAYRAVAVHARSQVLLSAAVNGIPALDSVYLDIPDLAGLRAESLDAAASGFAAKVCLHPSQLGVVRAAFAPDQARIAWARAVVAALERPGAGGVTTVDGVMVDEPLARQARRVLAAAGPERDQAPGR